MGQSDILEFLKKNKDKWFTSKEISELMGCGHSSIYQLLKKLRRSGLILFRQVEFNYSTREKEHYVYKYKS